MWPPASPCGDLTGAALEVLLLLVFLLSSSCAGAAVEFVIAVVFCCHLPLRVVLELRLALLYYHHLCVFLL